ncbi:MAG: zinc-ribbon domain-containing protein [Ardenticatenaceae bacterium]|nr:zinc-ribbon domain-containing protein [Ardenticatenaceae bacterium]
MPALTRCPTCYAIIPHDAAECPKCGQEFCPSCRAPIDADDVSCPRCGAEFAVFCSFCDEEIDPDAVICPHCGAALEEEDEVEKTAVPASDSRSPLSVGFSVEPELEAEETYTGQCPVCGTMLYVEDGHCLECGATFCGRCGQLIDEDDEICPHCHTPLFFRVSYLQL